MKASRRKIAEFQAFSNVDGKHPNGMHARCLFCREERNSFEKFSSLDFQIVGIKVDGAVNMWRHSSSQISPFDTN